MSRTISLPGIGDVQVPDDEMHRGLTANFYRRTSQNLGAGFDAFNTLVFRGDTRPYSEIFRTGFAKSDYGQVVEIGALVKGGISTSTDLRTVKQKYGDEGMYIYVCVVDGYDLDGVNSLSEILALYISPDKIIGCAGPVTTSAGYWTTTVVGKIVANPRYTDAVPDQRAVMDAMGDACRRGTVSESPF